jgi:hypothetical protein
VLPSAWTRTVVRLSRHTTVRVIRISRQARGGSTLWLSEHALYHLMRVKTHEPWSLAGNEASNDDRYSVRDALEVLEIGDSPVNIPNG